MQTTAAPGPTKRPFRPTAVCAIVTGMAEALAIIAFPALQFLGIANFALHRAVLESGYPLAEYLPGFLAPLGARLTLIAEFAMLLAAQLLAGHGWPQLIWAYLACSALNGMAAWLILSRWV